MAVRMLLGNSVIQPCRTPTKTTAESILTAWQAAWSVWVAIALRCQSAAGQCHPTLTVFFFLTQNIGHFQFQPIYYRLYPSRSLYGTCQLQFFFFSPNVTNFSWLFSPSQTPVTDLLAGSHCEVCTLWWRFPTAWQFKKLKKQTLLRKLSFILAFFEEWTTS